MKHPLTVEKYDGTLKELARDITNLRYDALTELFENLQECFKNDCVSDISKQRRALGLGLHKLMTLMFEARIQLISIWNICKKFEEKK